MVNTLGSVAFFSTYRPPLPLDLFSLPTSSSDTNQHELPLTDGESYNYNGKAIPPSALKLMLKRPLLKSVGTENDIDSGKLTGLIIVSERLTGLETLHIVLTLGHDKLKIFSFAKVYGTYDDVRMEDSPTFAGEYIFYITTKDPSPTRRQPWTAVYKTHLQTGKTERLTPPGVSDLNPVASPDGSKLAVASFERNGWHGEIESLKTDIVVIQLDNSNNRILTIRDGGWPSWGSEKVLFFHRKLKDDTGDYWAVFRADISNAFNTKTIQVTPMKVKAITPTAIDENTVIVGIIHKVTNLGVRRTKAEEYRHVEIYDSTKKHEPISITKKHKPMADHFNPFLIVDHDGQKRIGYHRGVIKLEDPEVVSSQQLMSLQSPTNNLGLFRVSGVFPTFSKDGRKLAFVDNEFQSVWVWNPDVKKEVEIAYTADKSTTVFSPVWSQDPTKDIVYFCRGPAFSPGSKVEIMALFDASTSKRSLRSIVSDMMTLTMPSLVPIQTVCTSFLEYIGTRLVFRSTKDGGVARNKSLYIREKANIGLETKKDIKVTRLTTKPGCTDTHCDWSPNGKWIVFSSSREKPPGTEPKDNGLDPGYFAVYLLAVDNPDVIVRVMQSAPDFAGHVNHPFFSPKGDKIVVSADIAGVSCDPVSLPLFTRSVRPYGDIFTVDIDPEHITNNQNIQSFERMTHSKFENSTCTWTVYSPGSAIGTSGGSSARAGIRGGTSGGGIGGISDGVFHGGVHGGIDGVHGGYWDLILNQPHELRCPFMHKDDGSEGWQMTGHLMIPNRQC